MRVCTVDGCGKKHVAKGYCGSHYNKILLPDRHLTIIRCDECGKKHTTTRTDGRFCSLACRDAAQWRNYVPVPPKPPKPQRPAPDMRSPIRRAVEASDYPALLRAIRHDSVGMPSGCWEWQRRLDRDGYPSVRVGKREVGVHRLSLEAKIGKPLGSQPAHHMCANTRCVNPDHLQPVTHRENAAEMLARNYMLRRIEELEDALAVVAPTHPLLLEVGVPRAA